MTEIGNVVMAGCGIDCNSAIGHFKTAILISFLIILEKISGLCVDSCIEEET